MSGGPKSQAPTAEPASEVARPYNGSSCPLPGGLRASSSAMIVATAWSVGLAALSRSCGEVALAPSTRVWNPSCSP